MTLTELKAAAFEKMAQKGVLTVKMQELDREVAELLQEIQKHKQASAPNTSPVNRKPKKERVIDG